MAGDLKVKSGAATVAVTVTNLHSLAASQTLVAGWVSGSVNNTSDLYRDYQWSATFTSHASNRASGVIAAYVIASLTDTPTWTAVSSGTVGTEGALAFADTFRRDAIVRPLWSVSVDTTASAIYTMPPMGVAWLFGGYVPSHHCLFISQQIATTTSAGFASSGSAVYYKPWLDQYT